MVDGGNDEIVGAKRAQRVLGQRLHGPLPAQFGLVAALPEAEHRHDGEDDERNCDRCCERQP